MFDLFLALFFDCPWFSLPGPGCDAWGVVYHDPRGCPSLRSMIGFEREVRSKTWPATIVDRILERQTCSTDNRKFGGGWERNGPNRKIVSFRSCVSASGRAQCEISYGYPERFAEWMFLLLLAGRCFFTASTWIVQTLCKNIGVLLFFVYKLLVYSVMFLVALCCFCIFAQGCSLKMQLV